MPLILHPAQRGGGGSPKRSEGETEGGLAPVKSRSRRKPGTTERARALRWQENAAEGLLWLELKGRKLGGHQFVRQLPIGPYFADFACRKRKLVVEVDGAQHADSVHDRRRNAFMRSHGYSVMRFWNDDVLKHRTEVCDTILAALDGHLREDVIASDLRFVFAEPLDPNGGLAVPMGRHASTSQRQDGGLPPSSLPADSALPHANFTLPEPSP